MQTYTKKAIQWCWNTGNNVLIFCFPFLVECLWIIEVNAPFCGISLTNSLLCWGSKVWDSKSHILATFEFDSHEKFLLAKRRERQQSDVILSDISNVCFCTAKCFLFRLNEILLFSSGSLRFSCDLKDQRKHARRSQKIWKYWWNDGPSRRVLHAIAARELFSLYIHRPLFKDL